MRKYRNRCVVNEHGRFDSDREYRRFLDLKLLERAGKIVDLKRQVPFELAPACVIGGRRRKPMRFIADFVYVEGGERVVEDSKGYRNRVYLLKRHLMKTTHDIDVVET